MYKVKERRESLGLTRTALAEKAGVSRQTIFSIETDMDFRTSTVTLIKIAKALNCNVSDIFLA